MLKSEKSRKTAFLLWLITAITGCTSKPQIEGVWKETSDNHEEKVGYKFQDGYAWVIIKGFEFGGEMKGKPGSPVKEMKYKVDDSKTPAWIDILVADKTTGLEENEGHLYGLFSFIDDNTVEMMLGKNQRDSGIDKNSDNYYRLERRD